MSDDKFDVIIVGGGIAGTCAGYLLAKEGLSVVLVERGNFCGAKNMTGGRLYSYSLEKVLPGFAAEAPVERRVVSERVSVMTDDDCVTVEARSAKPASAGKDSYVVLRGPFDRWLADQAEAAGALLVPGYRVDELIVRDGKVCGITSDGEEMESDVVILADGVNSLLAEKLGMRKRLAPKQMAVGAKEILQLSKEEINERFALSDDEGCAWSFFGNGTDGLQGEGFLYTNADSISLGLICNLETLSNGDKSLVQMFEEFKSSDAVAPFIKGTNVVEYSAHLVPEAGDDPATELYRDGVVVIGDAAGFNLNLGHIIRGMDLAIMSAQCAAAAILKAHETGDYSASSLSLYGDLLKQDPAIVTMTEQVKRFEQMENPYDCDAFPQWINDLADKSIAVNGTQVEPAGKIAELATENIDDAKVKKCVSHLLTCYWSNGDERSW